MTTPSLAAATVDIYNDQIQQVQDYQNNVISKNLMNMTELTKKRYKCNLSHKNHLVGQDVLYQEKVQEAGL